MAFASVQSCMICVGVVIVTVGKQSQILFCRLRTKSYFVGFSQYIFLQLPLKNLADDLYQSKLLEKYDMFETNNMYNAEIIIHQKYIKHNVLQ